MAERLSVHHPAPVLITGEAGTGKELLARWIHQVGPARTEPFVVMDCVGLPETLVESELFGQQEAGSAEAGGARRGLLELAAGGTVFLPDISRLPARVQPKLLRAIEDRRLRPVGGVAEVQVHCRVIAASSHPLETAVDRGELGSDLAARLSTFQLRLPPLRDRDGDLSILCEHLLADLCGNGSAPPRLHPDALTALARHHWPGNVRELKLVLERAILLAEDDAIAPEHLVIQHRFSRPVGADPPGAAAEILIPAEGKTLAQIEREAIALTLSLTEWNQSAAARTLGISRPTLARKIKGYELEA